MAETSIKIDLKYKEDTFENAKLHFQWITSAVKKLQLESYDYNFNYIFSYGNYSNSGKSYDEFIENACDVESFRFNRMSFCYEEIYISVDNDCVYINSKNKLLVHNLLELLAINDDNSTNTTNIYNAPVIQGDNNIVATDNANVINGDNNTINSHSTIQTKKDNIFKTIVKAMLSLFGINQ